jgi:hypothetical protein
VFLDSADTLIKSKGAREALATTLALAAALRGIKTTQILTGAEGSDIPATSEVNQSINQFINQ